MAEFHVVNVVHTEHDWWQTPVAGRQGDTQTNVYAGLDVGVSQLLQRLSDVEASIGQRVPITWCLWFSNGSVDSESRPIPDIIDCRLEFFQARSEMGDEIGIHPHAPKTQDQWRFIQANADRVTSLGFPPVDTHVGGWFETNSRVIGELESCKIGIDAGPVVRPGEGTVHGRSPDDHRSYRPYHPSRSNPWKEGASSVVRLPLFLSYHGIWDGATGFIDYTRRQYEKRDEVAVEIVHFFWHPFEMIHQETGGPNTSVIEGYHDLFREIGTWDDVVFSTAREAVSRWSDST